MRSTLSVLFVMFLLSGCSDDATTGGTGTANASAAAVGMTGAPTTATAATAASSATAPGGGGPTTLVMGNLKFSSRGKVGFSLKSDGTLAGPDGTPIGTVGADGTLKKSTGELVATLHGDGSITTASGTKMPITIDADGAMTMAGKTLRFNDAGGVVGGNPDAPGMMVEGVTPETHRTAMLVLAVMLTPGAATTAGPAPAPAPAPKPGPAPAPKPPAE